MKCLTCEKKLVPPLIAISHTISSGAKLCPECGQRESMDAGWAEGLRVGFRRYEAAMGTRGIVDRVVAGTRTTKHRRVARKKKRF